MLFTCQVFLVGIIISFMGWLMEVCLDWLNKHKLINRGFLIGPICPIYGIGSLLIVFLLKNYYDDKLIVFILSCLICSILEYFTSYIMETIFKARWWDYSDMKFNINGRICLETLIPFGILGCTIIYFIYPFTFSCVELLTPYATFITAGIVFFLLIFDIILSFNIIITLKQTARNIVKDGTEEITHFVKEKLTKKSIWSKRLVESFPDFKIIKKFRQKK